MGSETFADFMDWRPETNLFFICDTGREKYVMTTGAYSRGFWSSGPSRYVFDESGTMIDWTSDDGDDRRFQNQWDWVIPATQITLEEAWRVCGR